MLPSALSGTFPSVSAIVPMFNAASFIGEALESIFRQTRPVAEIIVVDDGSTDASVAIVSRYPMVKLLRKAHTGIGETVNEGIRAATGDILSFLDADDRWLPGKQ